MFKKKKSKKIWIVAVLFLLVVVAIVWIRGKKEEIVYKGESVVDRGAVQKTIDMDAVVDADVYAEISSELPTLIKSISVEKNDQVKKGQELFELDKKSISAQIANAKLAVQKAELAEKLARRKWDMLKPEEKDSIKKTTQQARETLRELYAQAAKTTMTSPIDGVVVEQNARVGEVAQGMIMRIIDPNSLQIEALVPEVDVAKIKKGEKAYITFDAYPGKRVEGRVASLDASSTLKDGNTYFKSVIDVDDKFKNEVLILDGMNADVDVEIQHRDNVLVVSRDFAKKDSDGYFVYVINEDESGKKKLVKKRFQAGLVGDNFVEVVSGLSDGDKVVLPEDDK